MKLGMLVQLLLRPRRMKIGVPGGQHDLVDPETSPTWFHGKPTAAIDLVQAGRGAVDRLHQHSGWRSITKLLEEVVQVTTIVATLRIAGGR